MPTYILPEANPLTCAHFMFYFDCVCTFKNTDGERTKEAEMGVKQLVGGEKETGQCREHHEPGCKLRKIREDENGSGRVSDRENYGQANKNESAPMIMWGWQFVGLPK